MQKCLIRLLTIVGIIFVVFALLGAAYVFLPFKSINVTVEPSSSTVVTQIKTMGKLETVSYTLQEVIPYDQNGGPWAPFWNLFGDHKKLFVVHGEVIAGVDLSGLSEKNIKRQGGQDIKTASITLNMPAPQILNASVDESQTKIYDASSGVYSLLSNQMDPNTVTQELANAKNGLKSDACQTGILQQAAKSAKTQLTLFLTAIGFQHVDVEVANGRCS